MNIKYLWIIVITLGIAGCQDVKQGLYSYPNPYNKNRLKQVYHVMGEDAVIKDLDYEETKFVFDDDLWFTQMQEIINPMSEPYKSEWQELLNQTTLPPTDPNRYFFMELRAKGEVKFSQGGETFFTNDAGDKLYITIADEPMYEWKWRSPERKLLMTGGMIHELRHLDDWLKRRDTLYKVTNLMKANQKVRSKNAPVTPDERGALILFGGEHIAREMLAFDRQFVWLDANWPNAVAELRKNEKQRLLFDTWKSGDLEKYAQVVYIDYKDQIWNSFIKASPHTVEVGDKFVPELAVGYYKSGQPDSGLPPTVEQK